MTDDRSRKLASAVNPAAFCGSSTTPLSLKNSARVPDVAGGSCGSGATTGATAGTAATAAGTAPAAAGAACTGLARFPLARPASPVDSDQNTMQMASSRVRVQHGREVPQALRGMHKHAAQLAAAHHAQRGARQNR